ncbi:T9SS type A sorting domain-containing protein, partial [bacterium]|nr:T9SS type A sorting domain-containing protein [bacterium]
MFLKKQAILGLLILSAAFAFWPSDYGDIQTGNSGSGSSSMLNRSMVMNSGGSLYCVYIDNSSDISAKRVYISLSIDGGTTWDSDWFEATDTGLYGRHSLIDGCALAIDYNEDLHVVWHRYQYSPMLHSTYYRKIEDIHSSPSGSEIIRVFDGSIKSCDSGIAMDSDGYIWLVTGGPTSWKAQIWRSDSVYAVGGTFSSVGSPSSGSTQGVSICLDANDLVHVAYYDNGVSASYAQHRIFDGTDWLSVDGMGNGSTGGRDHNCGMAADVLGNVHLLYGDNIGDVTGTWYFRYRIWNEEDGMGTPVDVCEFPSSSYDGVCNRYIASIACTELTGEAFILIRDIARGGSLCLYKKSLTDTAFTLAEELTDTSMLASYYYLPRMRGALYPEFDNTSIMVDLAWTENRSVDPHEVFYRYTLSEGPYLVGHFPSSNAWVSEDTVVSLNFIDLDGIDPTTASISVDGVVYNISDVELVACGNRLDYHPSVPWTDGTVEVTLLAMSDVLGHSTPDTGTSFSFKIDKTPPSLLYHEPDSALIADYVPDGALMLFKDLGCGSDSLCWSLTVNDLEFEPPSGGGIIIEGDTLVMLAFTLGDVTIPLNDTSRIYFTVHDKPDIGAPNEKTYYWWFVAATGIEETDLPANLALSAYPNPFNSSVFISAPEGAKIEIFDVNGRMVDDIPVGANLVFAQPPGDHKDRPYEFVWIPDENITSG